MRLRELELRRYGHFEDRKLDLGDGSVDFHFIVGPNEAGKSTLLTAISDLLFGIHPRTRLGFKHGMSELALAATLEDQSGSMAVVRRKKTKDPLTDPAGRPIAEAELDRFLRGLNRESFGRMYGLNYKELAEGGAEILKNRDDAARVVLEAEGGLTGLGQLIADLEGDADKLFGRATRAREIHNALKARDEAVKRSKDVVDERAWEAATSRIDDLEKARAANNDRSACVAGELAVLNRARRTAPLIAKLDERLADLKALAGLPRLPDDAADRLAGAERTIADRGLVQRKSATERERLLEKLAGIAPRSELLVAADEIRAAADERPVYTERLAYVPEGQRRLREIRSTSAKIRADVGLQGAVPSTVARQRLENAVEQLNAAVGDLERVVMQRARKAGELAIHAKTLSALADISYLESIRALEQAAPRNIATIVADDEAALAEAEHRLVAAIEALRPWTGDLEALERLAPPEADTVDDFASRLDEARRHQGEAQRRASEAADRTAELKAQLEAFLDGAGTLPTREALADARQQRAEQWATIRAGITNGTMGAGAAAPIIASFEQATDRADAIADERFDQAERVARHETLLAQAERSAVAEKAALDDRVKADGLFAAVEAEWLTTCRGLGFADAVSPARLRQWVSDRNSAINALRSCERARASVAAREKAHRGHIDSLRSALTQIDVAFEPHVLPDQIVARAVAVVRELEEAKTQRTATAALMEAIEVDLAELDAQIGAISERRTRWEQKKRAALAEVGLPDDADDTAIEFALAAYDELATASGDEAAIRDALTAAEDVVSAFEAKVAKLLASTDLKGTGDASLDARNLHAALNDAEHGARQRNEVNDRLAELDEEIAADAALIAEAHETLKQLAEAAGLQDPGGLGDIVQQLAVRSAAEADVERLKGEINDAGDGHSLSDQRRELEDLDLGDVVRRTKLLTLEQTQLADERERLAIELQSARQARDELGTGFESATALQEAAEITAAVAEQAERYVATRAAAVLLRWATARHRKTRAAPLLKRASAIIADITRGSISELSLDEDDDGNPIIVGLRADQKRVLVEEMSEGTRDQLYLALRLASLEDRVQRQPLPFICDDLLINCDDDRASLILKALHEMSLHTQVLCFTHHEHLRDIVQAAVGADCVQIHRL